MRHEYIKKVLMLASVASMIDQFNMPNICLLQDMGYEVHVACNFEKGNTCDTQRIQKFRKQLQKMHVFIHPWDCPRSLAAVADCARAYVQLVQLMEHESFAWLHCHSPIGGALARIAAHQKGVRVVYTAHGFHFYKGAPLKNWLLYYPAEKLLAHWTDVLITVNKEDYRFAKKKLGAARICYSPGVGIDFLRFQRSLVTEKGRAAFCRTYGMPEDAVILLSVGELNRGKNHRMAIKALAYVRRKDLYYLICGQGILSKKLLQYADRLGVGENIRMLGFQEDMPIFYRYADFFVLPSLREGMPAALMEAMASGLPCIVSNIRGSRELIDMAFMRVPPNGAKQLAAVLRRLLGDRHAGKLCGIYNREKIKGYGQDVVCRRMRKIYMYMDRMSVLEFRRDAGS